MMLGQSIPMHHPVDLYHVTLDLEQSLYHSIQRAYGDDVNVDGRFYKLYRFV